MGGRDAHAILRGAAPREELKSPPKESLQITPKSKRQLDLMIEEALVNIDALNLSPERRAYNEEILQRMSLARTYEEQMRLLQSLSLVLQEFLLNPRRDITKSAVRSLFGKERFKSNVRSLWSEDIYKNPYAIARRVLEDEEFIKQEGRLFSKTEPEEDPFLFWESNPEVSRDVILKAREIYREKKARGM